MAWTAKHAEDQGWVLESEGVYTKWFDGHYKTAHSPAAAHDLQRQVDQRADGTKAATLARVKELRDEADALEKTVRDAPAHTAPAAPPQPPTAEEEKAAEARASEKKAAAVKAAAKRKHTAKKPEAAKKSAAKKPEVSTVSTTATTSITSPYEWTPTKEETK